MEQFLWWVRGGRARVRGDSMELGCWAKGRPSLVGLVGRFPREPGPGDQFGPAFEV
jgi:hypothetical protein